MKLTIEEIARLPKGVILTRKCDTCNKPINSSVMYRRKNDDEHDFCSNKCSVEFDEDKETSVKKSKKKIEATGKKNQNPPNAEDTVEDNAEFLDDEDGTTEAEVEPEDDDESVEVEEADDEKPAPKKDKKGKKKSAKSDDPVVKTKKPKAKKPAGPFTAPVYDADKPIGTIFNRLKSGKKWKKADLYEGVDKAHVFLAWIKIHGKRAGSWTVEDVDKETVKFVRTKK